MSFFKQNKIHILIILLILSVLPFIGIFEKNEDLYSKIPSESYDSKLNKLNYNLHRKNSCQAKDIVCQFCELTMKQNLLDEHENMCGSKTAFASIRAIKTLLYCGV